MKAKFVNEALTDILKPKSPKDILDIINTKDTTRKKISLLIDLFEDDEETFEKISEFRDTSKELNEILMLLKISSLMKAGKDEEAQQVVQEIADNYGRDSLLTTAEELNALVEHSWRKEDNIFSAYELKQLKLNLYEKTKSEEEELRDLYQNSFIFIGYPDYKDVAVGGKMYKEERLGIENLLKVDLYNAADLQQASMMNMRAGTVPGGRVYAVWIMKDMWDREYAYNDDIPDDVREHINDEKFKI